MDLSKLADRLQYRIDMEGGQGRLRELILYISQKCENDPTFCATKLNKILYYADFESYAERGIPITGREYQCLQNGPAPVELVPLRREMIASDELRLKKALRFNRNQDRTIALKPPSLDLFSKEDIAFVDRFIDKFWGVSAKEISEASHDIRYNSCGVQNKLPYQTAFLSNEELTDEDIAYTQELVAKFGWL
jgi:hypothetical protein